MATLSVVRFESPGMEQTECRRGSFFFSCLFLEQVKAYGIGVSVAYPPDTDTPGFVTENKEKPAATHRISEEGGLFTSVQASKLPSYYTARRRITRCHSSRKTNMYIFIYSLAFRFHLQYCKRAPNVDIS